MKNKIIGHLEAAVDEIRKYTDDEGLLGIAIINIEGAIEEIKASNPVYKPEIQPENTRRSSHIRTYRPSDFSAFLPEEYVKRLVEAVSPGADFIGKLDMWEAYKYECHKNGRPTMERQFLNSAMYAYGYQDYACRGKTCWWKPGKPKPRPGKRAKRKEDK